MSYNYTKKLLTKSIKYTFCVVLYSLLNVNNIAAQESINQQTSQHDTTPKSKGHYLFFDLSGIPLYYTGYGQTFYRNPKVSFYAQAGFLFFNNITDLNFKNKLGLSIEPGVTFGNNRNQLILGVRLAYYYAREVGFWLVDPRYEHSYAQDYHLLHARIGWKHIGKKGKNWLSISAMPGIQLDNVNKRWYNQFDHQFIPTISFAIGRNI